MPAQATKGPTYSFNVTMLEHSCSYEFTIVAVSRTDGVLGRSRPSSHIVLSSGEYIYTSGQYLLLIIKRIPH